MPKNGYKNLCITGIAEEKFRNARQKFEPNESMSSFLILIAKFYRDCHCPECGAPVVKKQRHKCWNEE